MAKVINMNRTELVHRTSGHVDLTLVWVTGGGVDETVVCVHDRREDTYFEIVTELWLAFDVFYHPFAYLDFGTAVGENSRLAA